MGLYLKDPGALVDHAVAWDGYLDGQMIDQSAWTIAPDEPGGLSVVASAFDMNSASVRLGGGVAGHVYCVTNRVTLSDGQVDERSLTFRVEER